MLTIAARLTRILSDLCDVIAIVAARRHVMSVVWLGTRAFVAIPPPPRYPPLPAEAWQHLCARIARTATRVQALYDRFRAGTLPPRPTPAQPPRPPRPHAPSRAPKLPRAKAWVTARIGYRAAGYGCQLSALLDDPDFPEFLAAAPQAGRILRPLLHMLGIDLPPLLARPARPPAPRRVPPPPAPHAPTPMRGPVSPPLDPFLAPHRILPT